MDPQPRVCIDRVRVPVNQNERLALVNGSRWPSGTEVRVGFLDGPAALHTRIERAARAWSDHANITFLFGAGQDAQIRVAFEPNGSWSYIGTDCRRIAPPQPTMNFGWLSDSSPDEELERVVLHEFGHALGCIHEHQNPDGGIPWNKDAVYAYYTGPPNYWTREQVDTNLFQVYNRELTSFSALDKTSIMMYPIDPSFTTNGYSVGLNRALSIQDIAFIGEMYP